MSIIRNISIFIHLFIYEPPLFIKAKNPQYYLRLYYILLIFMLHFTTPRQYLPFSYLQTSTLPIRNKLLTLQCTEYIY